LNPRLLASRLPHAGTPAPQVHRRVRLWYPVGDNRCLDQARRRPLPSARIARSTLFTFLFLWTGYFQNIPNVYADLTEIVAGQKPGRESDQERIISMNLGLAIGDMAVVVVVSFLYERARKLGIGQWLPL